MKQGRRERRKTMLGTLLANLVRMHINLGRFLEIFTLGQILADTTIPTSSTRGTRKSPMPKCTSSPQSG